MKSEFYVDGDHRLSGREIMLDNSGIVYGGGSWVVIEPDGHHFWFVQNNGADGDDWSRNNVITGGAGAMGFRLPLTEEAKVLIDVVVGGKSGLLEKQASRVVSRHLRDSSERDGGGSKIKFYHASPRRYRHGDIITGGHEGGAGYTHPNVCMTTSPDPHATIRCGIPN
jgi:hypothetical protein